MSSPEKKDCGCPDIKANPCVGGHRVVGPVGDPKNPAYLCIRPDCGAIFVLTPWRDLDEFKKAMQELEKENAIRS